MTQAGVPFTRAAIRFPLRTPQQACGHGGRGRKHREQERDRPDAEGRPGHARDRIRHKPTQVRERELGGEQGRTLLGLGRPLAPDDRRASERAQGRSL